MTPTLIQNKLAETVESHRLFPRDGRILVGYSGGADSTCLLHALHALGYDLIAAHLHHGQRTEADLELQECQAFCERLGIALVTGHADVPRLAQDRRIGLEEAGRAARYAFFRQAARQTECTIIATAHTRTDRIETILFNIARGTGIAGLAGIPVLREGVARPLLDVSREETQAYCSELHLWTHDDPSNSDLELSRARIRHRVVPELRLVHPAFDQAILRLADTAGEEDQFLNGISAAALERAEVKLNGDLAFLTADLEIAFAREPLAALPRVPFRRAVRLAFEALGASLSHRQTAVVEEGMRDPNASGSVTSDGGEANLEWVPDRLHFQRLEATVPYRFPMTNPGATDSEEFNFTLVAVPGDGGTLVRSSLRTWLSAHAVKGALYFRTAQPGDLMRPFGFEGTRKISDLLSEAGLTRLARTRLPIVCDLVGPVWVPGVCVDQRTAWMGDGVALNLRFGPFEPNVKA